MTDDNTDDGYRLSRRKALAGIGTIGAAAGIGGLGTFASFTDTEDAQFTFTAGGIDGHLTAHMAYNGDDLASSLSPQPGGTPGVQISLDDVKPGDYGSICFDLEVENNPAWVASCIGIDEDIDHRTYEPEVAADPDVDASDIGAADLNNDPDGELAESTLVIPFYRESCPSNFWDPDGLVEGEPPQGDPVDVTYSALTTVGALATNADFWDSREGTADSGQLQPMTLRAAAEADLALDTIEWNNPDPGVSRSGAPSGSSVDQGCVFLDGAPTGTNNDDREAQPLQPGTTLHFGYDWHIPFGVGNEAQGDRVVFNLGFTFAQLRHTEAPELANVYSPGSNT